VHQYARDRREVLVESRLSLSAKRKPRRSLGKVLKGKNAKENK
jgi:hypothetical protein